MTTSEQHTMRRELVTAILRRQGPCTVREVVDELDTEDPYAARSARALGTHGFLHSVVYNDLRILERRGIVTRVAGNDRSHLWWYTGLGDALHREDGQG